MKAMVFRRGCICLIHSHRFVTLLAMPCEFHIADLSLLVNKLKSMHTKAIHLTKVCWGSLIGK